MIHVRRYLLALGVLLGVFCAYSLAVAPWIAPPKLARVAGKAAAAQPLVMELRPDLAALFPPEAWERKNPKIVETEQCTLLIQDYLTTPDGRLELKPCTLVFESGGEASEGQTKRGRPVVLQAPKAELTFDKPFDVARGEFGRVEKGTLSGQIRVFSPPTQADAQDAFELVTRAVWLDRDSIRTANDVEFRYGTSSGLGRDLEIALIQPTSEQPAPDQPRAKSKLRGVHSVTLKQLDYLRVATAGGGLLPGGGAGQAAKPAAPLEIRCRGHFTYEVTRQVARFQDGVMVSQPVEGGLPDTLKCRELLLDLSSDEKAAQTPAASAEDPLAGRLKRVIALGEPVVLESPSRGIRGEAAWMEYSLAQRSVHLKSDPARQSPRVTLVQLDQHFVAPELHYEMPASGRLGKLNAAGPGELRMADRGRQRGIVTARWGRSLEMRPQEGEHVISLREAASVDMETMGQFQGNELHLWVLEAPAAAMASAASAQEAPPPSKAQAAILPHRLLAIDNVRMVSPGLDMDTGRLEAWFTHLPAEQPPPRQPRGIDHPIREPVARVSYAEAAGPDATIHGARPREQEVPGQKFHVTGDVVRTQLVVRGSKFDIEDLSIRGHAQMDEVTTPEPNLEPLRVRGDFLEVRAGTQPQATAQISGFPAEVAGRGMALAGSKIEMQRSTNEVRINGPGEARLPAGPTTAGGGLVPLPGASGASGATPAPPMTPQAAPQPVHIVWQERMVFDGLVARFMGDVQVRTASQTAHMPALEATLSRRLDFGVPLAAAQDNAAQSPVDLARVLLDGGERGVYIESRGMDERGELVSRDQMSVRGAVLDQISGSLHAQGPGWVSTVRRGSHAPGAAGVPTAVAVNAPQDANQLTSIHVAFERELVGDLNQKWIEFRQEVRTTYSPVDDFGDVIAADPLAPLGERMVLMRSQTLRITDTSFAQARSFDLTAEGGAKVEGRNMFVDAPRLKYASDKESLTIEGDGRVLARIDYFGQDGRPITTQAQRIWYNLRTGQLKMDGGNIQFPLGGELKLPGWGGR